MHKHKALLFILMLLTVCTFSFVSHADTSNNKPKNFRIMYMSEDGKELEYEDHSAYVLQQIFLDKLLITSYIDPEGYEYNPTGYRIKTWPGRNFEGEPSEDKPVGYYELADQLGKIYGNQDPPFSIQATIVLHPNGGKYSPTNLVRVIWLNQDSDLVKEVQYTIGRGESYTDEVPTRYTITSVKAFMMDMWKINNETTIDPAHPTVTYDKFGEEYSIIYRMELTPEQEAEIKGIPETTGEEESSDGTDPETSSEENGSASETTEAETEESTTAAPETTKAYPATEAASETESSIPDTTKTDESYSGGGSSRITLIIGCVIAVIVIYLVIISIGINSNRNRKKKKKRL